MFPSNFRRKPVGLYKSANENEKQLNFSTNGLRGNMSSVPQIQGQAENKNQFDSINSINSGPNRQFTSPRRSQENAKIARNINNRRSNATSSWKKQPAGRPAENTQTGYARGNVKNAPNKQTQFQPAVFGTNTFQPSPKPAQDSSSLRNPAVNNLRSLTCISELPSEISSSYCYITQGNLTKGTFPKGSKQAGTFEIPTEPNLSVTDYCAFCLNKQKFELATHHCRNCGPFGRYICLSCLGNHNYFTVDHDVQSLSGQNYRKQSTAESENIEIVSRGTHPNFITDVSIKTNDDVESCQITGFCQLDDGTIVFTEMNNKAIKTLDCQTYQVMNTLELENYPMGICCIGENEVLVILYKSTIQYARIKETKLELNGEHVLEHDCLCLAFCEQKIYIGSSTCLYIYDKKWKQLDMITNDALGDEKVFSDQFSIAVSTFGDVTTIYVADENTGMYAVELSSDYLTKTWKFKDCKTFKASGLCFDSSNNILLSDRGSERLIKMNADGMILAILLDSHSGIQPLNMIFYDRKNSNLLVSLSGKNILKVFDFK